MNRKKSYREHLEDEHQEVPKTTRWRLDRVDSQNLESNTNISSDVPMLVEDSTNSDGGYCLGSQVPTESLSISSEPCTSYDLPLNSSSFSKVETDAQPKNLDGGNDVSDEEWNNDFMEYLYEAYNTDDQNEDYSLPECTEETVSANASTRLFQQLQDSSFFDIINASVKVSPAEIMMMVLKFALRFSLPHVAVVSLFAMINCIFSKRILPDTRYLVDEMFSSREISKHHSICPNCGAYNGTYEHHDIDKTCNECEIVIKLRENAYVNFFVTYRIANDIKALLEANDEYYDDVVTTKRHESGVFRDIYDGRAYKKFVESLDPVDRRRYITITFNIDGAPVFVSSTFSIWPIQIVINETPLHIRSSKTILFALWFGKNKPDMNVFLNAFVQELNELTDSGIMCTIRGEERLIKPYALCCCVDTIARAPMQGIIQFNGKNGCNWCLHPGEWVPNKSETGGSMKYPLLDPIPPERNEENTLNFMAQTISTGAPAFGVNRVTPLINLQKFDVIYGFVPDDMHFLRLGIGKQFLNYFLDRSKSPLESVLTSAQIDEMDILLSNFQVPNQVMRPSRPIRDRKFWKAKEWENWILYFSVPILSLFVEKKLILHWALLVEAFHISLQPVLTTSDIKCMQDLILKFLFLSEKFYGKQAFTYNLHQLLHWLRSIVDWGPSWTHTGFVFESGNGRLLKKIKSAKGVISQISRSLAMKGSETILAAKVIPRSSAYVKTFCTNLEQLNTKKTCKPSTTRYFGNAVIVNQTWAEKLGLSREAVYYKRIIRDRCLFSSAKLKRIRSNNSYALLRNGTFVELEEFIFDEFTGKEYTIVTLLKTEKAFSQFKILHKVQSKERTALTAIDTNEIAQICVYLQVRNIKYLCPVPNVYYI